MVTRESFAKGHGLIAELEDERREQRLGILLVTVLEIEEEIC
jgi:hypothetical protein